MTLRIVAAMIAALFALTACDDDGATIRSTGSASDSGTGVGSGTGSASGTEAEACEPSDTSDPALVVTLDEFHIDPAKDRLTVGPTRFRALNAGNRTHEFYVAEARNIAGLPLDPKGSVDVEALEEDDRLIGELEGIPSGESCDLKVDLDLGTYVLFCNIRERTDEGVVNHFLQGMRTRFKVR